MVQVFVLSSFPPPLLSHPRVIATPVLPRPSFYDLLARASTFLDPYPFGGGDTALEALARGCKVVTCAGCQGVPTLAKGFLGKLEEVGVEGRGEVAEDEGGYVEAAIRAGVRREGGEPAVDRRAPGDGDGDAEKALFGEDGGETVGGWSDFLGLAIKQAYA